MDPFLWFLYVLGMTATPYSLLAAYRYLGKIFMQI
jgi:hypothetical protein